MEKKLGYEIKRLSRLMKQYIDNSDFMKGNANMTGMQGWVLRYLSFKEGQDIFQKDVEREFRIRRSTATELLKVMESGGLIQRVPVKEDARLKKIIITPYGQQLNLKCEEVILQAEEQLTSGFSKQEIELMFELINRCKQNLINNNNIKENEE